MQQGVLESTSSTSNRFELLEQLSPEVGCSLSCIGTLLQENIVHCAPNVTCIKNDLALGDTTFVHRWQTFDLIPELRLGASVLLSWVHHLSSGISEDHVLELEPVDGICSTTVVIEASIWSMLLVRQCKGRRGAFKSLVLLLHEGLELVQILDVQLLFFLLRFGNELIVDLTGLRSIRSR